MEPDSEGSDMPGRLLRSIFASRERALVPPKPPVDELDFWIDPDPNESPGILLSDRIRFYVKKVNLVYPFDETELRPASYTLHAGTEYLISHPGKLVEGDLERDGTVVIPPNGLIYIRFWEEVNIPYYMIARFNLRVKQVYRGLLLGTGPQVDPGFRGHLGCPIHNFTDEDKILHFKERLVTIDFEKTTPLAQVSFLGKTDRELRSLSFDEFRRGITPVLGLTNQPCLIFRENVDRPLREYLPPGESVKSSVLALQGEVDRLKSQWTIFKAVAVGGALVGLLAAGAIVFDAYRDLKTDVVNLNKQLGQMEGSKGSAVVAPERKVSPGTEPQKALPPAGAAPPAPPKTPAKQ
jgi:deoxycytidine triphosphate deaminase